MSSIASIVSFSPEHWEKELFPDTEVISEVFASDDPFADCDLSWLEDFSVENLDAPRIESEPPKVATRVPDLGYLKRSGSRVEGRSNEELLALEDRIRERRRRASKKHAEKKRAEKLGLAKPGTGVEKKRKM